ncbi:hypothetical protein PLESTM_000122600 [Pleodorina starrii]|nr:hypothetical protein PLESTM_000122600 [Pleodorina starrii]
MTLKVSAPDGVKVYHITSGKTLPQWLAESKKKSLKKNEEYRRRLELIQDFGFKAAAQRIKITPDRNYVFATGYHPFSVRCFDLANLSMKFERNLDAEVVDFCVLSEDYSKLAFLCTDRSVMFHARFGSYYRTRVPKFGRDLAYFSPTAELLVVGSAPEVYRINLQEGRFMSPLPTTSPAVNACGIAPSHGLFAAAGEDGQLECFDLRQREAVGLLDAAAAAGAPGEQLTALRFDDSGLHVAVGTSNGLVALYDLRSQRPLVVKDHMYGSRIVDIKFHTYGADASAHSRRVISADRHIVKVWDINTGEGYTSIEPEEGDINDVCVWPDSGLIMVANDTPHMHGYFVPSLGPAPRWCSHLEALTEELAEAAPAVYDDYRFVTRADLTRLGLDHLLGTSLLRAYMHGFFVDNRLYAKAKSLMDPFAYETYRQQRITKKMEEERKARISIIRKLPKVNTKVAARLMAESAEAAAAAAAAAADGAAGGAAKAGGQRAAAAAANPLADSRFAAMFEDPDFAIDEEAEEYRLLHPNAAREKKAQDDLLREHFQEVLSGSDNEDDDGGSEDDDGADSLDEMDERPTEARARPTSDGRSKPNSKRLPERRPDGPAAKRAKQADGGGGVGPSMFVARDAAAAEAFRRGESLAERLNQPLADRLASAPAAAPSRRLGGSREVSFVPRGGGFGRGGGGFGRGRDGGGRGRDGGGRGRDGGGRGRGGRGRGFGGGGGEEAGGGSGGGRGRGRGRGGGGGGRGGGGRRGGGRGGRGGRGRGGR